MNRPYNTLQSIVIAKEPTLGELWQSVTLHTKVPSVTDCHTCNDIRRLRFAMTSVFC
jgi:hypothetical protein